MELGIILFSFVIVVCLAIILKQLKDIKDNQEYLMELQHERKNNLQNTEKNHPH